MHTKDSSQVKFLHWIRGSKLWQMKHWQIMKWISLEFLGLLPLAFLLLLLSSGAMSPQRLFLKICFSPLFSFYLKSIVNFRTNMANLLPLSFCFYSGNRKLWRPGQTANPTATASLKDRLTKTFWKWPSIWFYTECSRSGDARTWPRSIIILCFIY